METFERSVALPHPADRAFAWHERPGAFERYAPPRQRVETLERTGSIRDGDRVTLRVRLGPFSARWTLQHQGYRPAEAFDDRQLAGPYRSWRHQRRFHATGESSCELHDRITYELGLPAALLGRAWHRRTLERAFRYRHARLRRDLDRHASGPAEPRRVLITGASGLIGGALTAFLTSGGHQVTRLVRRAPAAGGEIAWNPDAGRIDADALDGFDAVFHLAGESIGAGRWTDARRRRIRGSRIASTGLLCGALARLRRPPAVLVSASAVGYYGEADGALDESAPAGDGFLAEVTAAWEQAAEPARAAGIRVAHARLGPVLSPAGGLLKRLLPVFRAGAGGVVGSGRQPISWIGLDDAVGALHALMVDGQADGAFNVTAPEAATNRQLTAALAAVLRRPALAPVPAFAIRALFGEMGDRLILNGQRAVPARLTRIGFRWLEPALEGALRWELGIPAEDPSSTV